MEVRWSPEAADDLQPLSYEFVETTLRLPGELPMPYTSTVEI
jgi:hypothetical protein